MKLKKICGAKNRKGVTKEVDADLPRFPALKNPETTENKTNGENQDPCGRGSISFIRRSQLLGYPPSITFSYL